MGGGGRRVSRLVADFFGGISSVAMEKLSVKSGFFTKLRESGRIFAEEGVVGFFRAARNHLGYHLSHKWRFVYLEFALEKQLTPFKLKEPVAVKIAAPEHLDRIRSQIFPLLVGELSYDRRYFDLLDQPGVKCFLAEINGKLIHYSWVFLDASRSPLMDVPFSKAQLRPGDAYVGPIFTNSSFRGLVYLQVLSVILLHLREAAHVRRVIVFVDGKNPAAVTFYKRMGFQEIEDAVEAGLLARVGRKFGALS